jgi:hypothetical protein
MRSTVESFILFFCVNCLSSLSMLIAFFHFHILHILIPILELISTFVAISCRKMFIGGLNWDTTDGIYLTIDFTFVTESCYIEGLRDYFSQFGKVDACTIMRDAAGRSRCFAFLTFEEPASVNAVMVREHVLDGKIVS